MSCIGLYRNSAEHIVMHSLYNITIINSILYSFKSIEKYRCSYSCLVLVIFIYIHNYNSYYIYIYEVDFKLVRIRSIHVTSSSIILLHNHRSLHCCQRFCNNFPRRPEVGLTSRAAYRLRLRNPGFFQAPLKRTSSSADLTTRRDFQSRFLNRLS